jgi:pimeloyl-ACP methyl ester carboxylesterase
MSTPTDQLQTRGGLRQRLALAGVRGSFRLAERLSPAVGARLAEALWFTAPRTRRSRTGPAGGHTVRIDVAGRTVIGERWGSGPTVVLMHGWGGHRGQFRALVEPLTAAGFAVLALDAPGHGESEAGAQGRRQVTILEFADALTAACTALGPVCAVVAHSLGGMATAVALRDGLQVDCVVLVAPMAEVSSFTRHFAAQLGFGERIRTRLVPRIERRVDKPLSYFDIPAIAGTVATPPLLLIHDRDDRDTAWSGSEAIRRAWGGARLITVTGLGHRAILNDGAVVAETVSFVAAHLAERSAVQPS